MPAPVLNDTDEPTEIYDFSHVKPQTAAIRRLFVSEYIKDFNGTAAMGRLGFNYRQPAIVAHQWLREPYTQYLLGQLIEKAESDNLVTRNEVLVGLKREANSFGLDSSGASRVSALGKLAKILGLEINRSEVDVRIAGGIMLIPLAESPDAWERNAEQAQLALKQEASA